MTDSPIHRDAVMDRIQFSNITLICCDFCEKKTDFKTVDQTSNKVPIL